MTAKQNFCVCRKRSARDFHFLTAAPAADTLDESGPALPSRTEMELLRIAQEAIGNVRRHAHAENLWVTLVSDGAGVRLPGRGRRGGQRRPKDRHWGLQTMRERAETIGAEVRIIPEPAAAPSSASRPANPPHPKGTAPMSTTVLLVDDHELIRQGLARAFERDQDMTVIGQAGTWRRRGLRTPSSSLTSSSLTSSYPTATASTSCGPCARQRHGRRRGAHDARRRRPDLRGDGGGASGSSARTAGRPR